MASKALEGGVEVRLVKNIFATVAVDRIKIGPCLPNWDVKVPKSISLTASGLIQLLETMKQVLEVFAVGVENGDEIVRLVNVPSEVLFIKQTDKLAIFGIAKSGR